MTTLLLLSFSDASARRIESLVMPDVLISGHAKYEEECERCHLSFSKTGQSELCRDCHEKVDADIKQGKGFHGKKEDIKDTECKDCHTDHQGRDAVIVLLDRDAFDHKMTDFLLKGSHDKINCGNCHKPDIKFRDAKHQCVDCHKSDDRHNGNLGEKCQDCHDEKTWLKGEFDHDKTDFPLIGEHREATCESCHPDERYKNVPTDCYSCHKLNDVHGGRYGKKCKDCHSERKWDKAKFDHHKTDFPLTGEHRFVSCDACHTGDINKKLGTKCYSCHKLDDAHRGRFGRKCKSCHSPKKWDKVNFDHSRDTDWPLRATHKKIACESCHKGELSKENLKTNCIACHLQDDSHHGQEGEKCEECHSEKGWSTSVRFDHDLSKFPLIGVHAIVPCEECHFESTFKDAATKCSDCHQADDVHKKRLGSNCELCHNPNSWALWEFKHNTQTDYSLEGKHDGLDCTACHKEAIENKIELRSNCYACHAIDDAHKGTFGRNCEQCHSTKSFSEVGFSRSIR